MSDEIGKDISMDETKETQSTTSQEDISRIIDWVTQIKDENTREHALAELSRKRESFADLALYIWYSSGTVASLLQEIINTYQLLAPPVLNIQSSNRACNVLALFQCVAAHAETRPAFLNAQIPIFLYPFLNTVNKTKPFEYLRLTALGVIGALVKIDNSEVINFLLSTEIIPLCLRIMERGTELSKTVATFIVQRILLDEYGLNYVCNTAERFYAISSVLYNMINSNPSPRLIKHIIRSYARLADNTRVRSLLRDNLPVILKDKVFIQGLDESSKRWIQNLMKQLNQIEKTNISNTNVMGTMNSMGNMMGSSGVNMNNIGGISTMGNLNTLVGGMPMSNMGGINNMGNITGITNMPNMGSLNTMGPNMGGLNSMGGMNLSNMGGLGNIANIGALNNMSNMSNISTLNQMNPQAGFMMQNSNPENGFGCNMYGDNFIDGKSIGYGNTGTSGKSFGNNLSNAFFSYKTQK